MNLVENPQDGMIVERYPGIYFQYDKSTNSWIRLDGYKSIKLATQISPGLMPKEDYRKVQRLLTAPPKTSLTSDQCGAVFSTGAIRLFSKDHSVYVEDFLDLIQGNNVVREKWHIHEDTWGFNFRINLQFLVDEMKKRGNLISKTIVGPKGLDGDRGDPGVDRLDTGPEGPAGEDGEDTPFDGILINTSLRLKDKSKVVVDIDTEKVSEDENYLIVYKGVVGPERLCTRFVNAQSSRSSWVLVRNQKGIACVPGCVRSEQCIDETNFIDIDIIADSVKNHTEKMILAAKKEREDMASEWLKTLMKVFNEQKRALCCALENCRSRKRNQDERRYIETQRIAAANGDFKLLISDQEDDESIPQDHTKEITHMDEVKTCFQSPTQVQPGQPNPLALLVVVYIDEASPSYNRLIDGISGDPGPPDLFLQDLAAYNNAAAAYTAGPVNVLVFRFPLDHLVPQGPITGYGSVVHQVYVPQPDIIIADMSRRPGKLTEQQAAFNSVTGGAVPIKTGFIIDISGSMIRSYVEPIFGQFTQWVAGLGSVIETKEIKSERWLYWSSRFINNTWI